MAKYPERRTRGLVKMDVLSEGEENRAHRIRTATAVHEWLAAMTATERGDLLTEVHAAHLKAQEAQTVPIEDRNTLRVLGREVPVGLRWKPERCAQVAALLAQGDLLTLTPASPAYLTATGGRVPRRTAEALTRAGILAPLTH